MNNNKYIKRHNLLVIIVCTVFTVYGCNKINDLGVGLLPPGDLLDVRNTILKEDISAYTFLEDSVITSNATKSLLGSFNDPIFGNTTINFATQFRIQSFPDYGTNPTIDSTFLYLYYRTVYGDTTTTQQIRVYELEDPIYYDTTDSAGKTSEYIYYYDVDLKQMASPQIIGQVDFIPKVSLDSTSSDTLAQILKIPVDVSIAEKLVSADQSNIISNDAFLDYFKGVFIETEKVDSGGAIISLETTNTALVVYYNNDENRADTLPDTLNMAYYMTEFSARVNNFVHDYSSTPFYNNLNSDSNEDSLIFIQAMGGLESKIKIDNLSSWKDSVVIINGDSIKYIINKAELIFNVDTTITDIKKFPLPNRLLFTYIDTAGQQFLPRDYAFYADYYGGTFVKEDYTYRFNITQHLQQIINGEIENRDFYLKTANSNSEANRVVLKGSTSKKGIQLIVTYTKAFP